MPWHGETYEGEFPSLGYRLVEWYAENLQVPSGQMLGKPFVLTDEQARFVIRLYRIDPETGKRVYRRGVLRRPKGWGKSPCLAAFAIGELCGPVVFDGWDAVGRCVGVEHGSPWVQIAACSEDQTDNTYVAAYEMLRTSPAVDEYGLDIGITRIFLAGRPGRLEPVTASSGSREGQPLTSAVLDETHIWLPNNGGVRLAATVRRNIAKMGGATVESTNAYAPGQGSVAEASEKAWSRGQRGLLFDAGPKVPEVRNLQDREEMMPAIRVAYGDSSWIDVDRIFEDANDADTDPADARRFYLNQIVKGSEQAFDVERFSALVRADVVVGDQDYITLGFDGARFHDSSAIVATHVETGYQWVVGLWEDDGSENWEVDQFEVEETLAQVFDRYEVWRLYADPPYWETQVKAEWPQRFGVEQVVTWDTRPTKTMAYAIRAYINAIRSGELSHDGSTHFVRHIANARRRETQMRDENGLPMWVMQKEHSNSALKIDLAMAAVLSWEARSDAIAAGALRKKKFRAGGF